MAGIQEKAKKVGRDLTQGNILELLVSFSVPIVLANLLQQVYSMVDLIVIGQYVGNIGTVGVSVGSEIMDFLSPIAIGFAGAAQVYISQIYGAKDEEKLRKAIGTMITFMMLLSVIFLIVCILFSKQLIHVLNCPEEAVSQALDYLRISAFGLPFIFGYNAIGGLLRGIGESKRPMYFVGVAAIVNIFADILLVAVFHLEAAGTAIATVASQIGSFVAAFIYMYKRREQFGFELKLSYFGFDKQTMKVLMALGIPRMLQSLGVRFSLLWCQANINSYGLVASATNSIGNKMQKLITVFVQGVNQGSGAMVGQNLGAKKKDRVKQTVWTTFGICMTIASIGAVMALTIPRPLFRIFTADPDVLDNSVLYMRIMAITYFSAALLGPFQAMVSGSGYAFFDFVLGMMDGVVCRIGLSALYAFAMGMGVTGFFLGNATARIIPGFLAMAYFLSGRWEKRKLLVE